jgi:orotidine-5'-phosphate decarboxylase
MLCVGLDPDVHRLPPSLTAASPSTNAAVETFCREIVDATADLVCAFKPQIAHFAALGAERELERVCAHMRSEHPDVLLILDAKRGDIGSTAERYAAEAFDRYGAHVVTVNPYLGGDSIEPFLTHDARDPDSGGVFVLCRTSNPGSGDLQSLLVDSEPLYLHVARRVVSWNELGDCGLVVGATYPSELADVRALVGDLPLLVPGIGAQGGDIAATVSAGRDTIGFGMAINSSRAILYADASPDWPAAARSAAQSTVAEIRSVP